MATVFTTDQLIEAMRKFEQSINKHMESPHPFYSPRFARMMRDWVDFLTNQLKSGSNGASDMLSYWSDEHPDEFVEFMEGVIDYNLVPDRAATDDDIQGFWDALK